LKKKTIHLLGFIEFLILLSTLLFFVLASEKSMIFLVDKVANAFNIEYQKLEGNILKDITLHDLTYQDKKLAQKAHIDINFKALLSAQLKIDDITLQEVNLQTIEQMIEDQNSGGEKKKIESIPTINIASLFFSTEPYRGHDLNIDHLKFIANDIEGDLRNLSIGSFSFYTQSDHTNITADGSINDKILDFNHLWITDIDIDKIIQFYNDKIKKSEDNNHSKQGNQKGLKSIIKEFRIRNFKTDIKRYEYKKYKISTLRIEAEDLKTDLISISAKTKINAATNMWQLSSNGILKDNRLITDVDVSLNDKYFKRFIPFFDHNKINRLAVALEVGKEGLNAQVNLKTDNLLIGTVKDLNLSVENAIGDVNLSFKPINLEVQIDGNLTAKHSKNIALDCQLHYDKKNKFSYKGILFSKSLQNLDGNFTKMMKDTKVHFYGNSKNIQASLSNKNLSADYNSTIYTKGALSLKTQMLTIGDYITLPPELKTLQATLKSQIPINFKALKKYDADVKIESNALNIMGKLTYDEGFELDATAHATPNSLLKNYDKNLKLKALFPLQIKTTWSDSLVQSKFVQKEFSSDLSYNTQTKQLESISKLSNDTFSIKGNTKDNLFFKATTVSLKTLQENISKFYDFTIQPLDGEIVINGIINKNGDLDLDLKSRWLVYEYRENKFAFAEKIKLQLNKIEDRYILNSYYLSTFLDHDRIFFAKKPSLFSYKNSQIVIDNLWINDQASLLGHYNLKKSSGAFNFNATSYHYDDTEANIYADANLRASLSPQSIEIEGKIDFLKGVITYKAKKEHYIQDDDIIVVQEERAKQLSKKENNFIIDVAILSKKPISYKVEDTDVLLNVDLKFWKDKNSELELLGITKLIEGTHIEAKKEFKLKNGEILFAGPILNPYLNINVSHFNDPYDITININGLLDAPIINFSATPFLTQSDILSILLFDATTEDLFSSSGDSSKAAISMFGNTFAKELVENFGIKLDKLVLSTTEEGGFGLEVGKKISRKMTILYINDIVQTIKVKYQHSRRFETDITFSPDTSGIDFLYKNEY
jgi:translocation and assembly module TamB